MKTLAELEAEHKAAREKLEAELAIASTAPLPPKRAHLFKPIPWLIYDAATIADALAIMNAAPIVPFDRTKAQRGKFTRLWPWSIASADTKDDWQSISAPWAASIRVNQGPGFGPSAELRYFVQCGEHSICAVHINLVDGYRDAYPAWRAQAIRRAPQSRYGSAIIEWRANNLLAATSQQFVKWGTGNKDCADFEYLFSADYESGGAEFATASILSLVSE